MTATGERITSDAPVEPDDAARTAGDSDGQDDWAGSAPVVHRNISERIGIALLLFVLLIAVLGPFVRQVEPSAVVGKPFERPSSSAYLGTDYLGRDVLSRLLSGGWILICAALASTLLAYSIGIIPGLYSGYRRGRAVDVGTMAIVDVFVSIPPIVTALVVIAALGGGIPVGILAVAVVQAPSVARLMRSFTISIKDSEYIEAARARGEGTSYILFAEILPNTRRLLAGDAGIRFTWSIMLFSSISFLGFGPAPPRADWGVMIFENRSGLLSQPFSILAPVVAISILTIGLNLATERVLEARERGTVR